ncbi:MAG: helix-turn-helix transcriptional regulator, partial [Natronospirillum sp.]
MSEDFSAIQDILLDRYTPKTLDFSVPERGLDTIVARNLRNLRRELGWCQSDAADKMEVSIHQYRKYERGGDYVRMSSIALFMQRSGIPFPYLFIGSAYEYVFKSMNLRAELLPMQIFAGRSSDVQFMAMMALLCDNLGVPSPAQDDISTLRWPCPAAVDDELQNYYRLVARGLRHFRQALGMSQLAMAELLDVAIRTLARYEIDGEEPHFNVLMTMRLWAGTGIPPIWLMHGTEFFNMRMLQHQRMAYLNKLLAHTTPGQLN